MDDLASYFIGPDGARYAMPEGGPFELVMLAAIFVLAFVVGRWGR